MYSINHITFLKITVLAPEKVAKFNRKFEGWNRKKFHEHDCFYVLYVLYMRVRSRVGVYTRYVLCILAKLCMLRML
jgi:hypothetical protein